LTRLRNRWPSRGCCSAHPTIVLIPGTSSVEHLRENVAAASLQLPTDAIEKLDAIGA
jgi:aryl-alcohol dehydrogenase-like predicted oxidoreductase